MGGSMGVRGEGVWEREGGGGGGGGGVWERVGREYGSERGGSMGVRGEGVWE